MASRFDKLFSSGGGGGSAGRFGKLFGGGGGGDVRGLPGASDRLNRSVEKSDEGGFGDWARGIAEGGLSAGGKVLGGAMDLLDTSKSAVVATAIELGDVGRALTGKDKFGDNGRITDTGVSFGDIIKNTRNNVGVGDILEANTATKSLPLNVKRGLGFVGDVAVDPLTYVTFGAKTAAVQGGKAGSRGAILGADEITTRLLSISDEAIDAAGASRQLVNDAAAEIAGKKSAGVLGKKRYDSVRAALGPDVKVGVTFDFGRLGSATFSPRAAGAVGEAGFRGRSTVSKPVTWFVNRNGARRVGMDEFLAKWETVPGLRKLRRSNPILAVQTKNEIVSHKAAVENFRAKWAREFETIRGQLNDTVDKDTLRRALEDPQSFKELGQELPDAAIALRRFMDNMLAEAEEYTGKQVARLDNYLPHQVTADMLKMVAGDVEYTNLLHKRGLVPETFGVGDGSKATIDAIHDAAQEVFGEDFIKIFEDDPWQIAGKYIDSVAALFGREGIYGRLQRAGLAQDGAVLETVKQALSTAQGQRRVATREARRLGRDADKAAERAAKGRQVAVGREAKAYIEDGVTAQIRRESDEVVARLQASTDELVRQGFDVQFAQEQAIEQLVQSSPKTIAKIQSRIDTIESQLDDLDPGGTIRAKFDSEAGIPDQAAQARSIADQVAERLKGAEGALSAADQEIAELDEVASQMRLLKDRFAAVTQPATGKSLADVEGQLSKSLARFVDEKAKSIRAIAGQGASGQNHARNMDAVIRDARAVTRAGGDPKTVIGQVIRQLDTAIDKSVLQGEQLGEVLNAEQALIGDLLNAAQRGGQWVPPTAVDAEVDAARKAFAEAPEGSDFGELNAKIVQAEAKQRFAQIDETVRILKTSDSPEAADSLAKLGQIIQSSIDAAGKEGGLVAQRRAMRALFTEGDIPAAKGALAEAMDRARTVGREAPGATPRRPPVEADFAEYRKYVAQREQVAMERANGDLEIAELPEVAPYPGDVIPRGAEYWARSYDDDISRLWGPYKSRQEAQAFLANDAQVPDARSIAEQVAERLKGGGDTTPAIPAPKGPTPREGAIGGIPLIDVPEGAGMDDAWRAITRGTEGEVGAWDPATGQRITHQDLHPERYDSDGRLKQGEIETHIHQPRGGETAVPHTFDVTPLPAGMTVDDAAAAGYKPFSGAGGGGLWRVPNSERPLRHVFRVVDEAEYQEAVRTGRFKSDQRMNFGDEGTVTSTDATGTFYLPPMGKGDQTARIIKVRVDEADGALVHGDDGYVKYPNGIPIERVEGISPELTLAKSKYQKHAIAGPSYEPSARAAAGLIDQQLVQFQNVLNSSRQARQAAYEAVMHADTAYVRAAQKADAYEALSDALGRRSLGGDELKVKNARKRLDKYIEKRAESMAAVDDISTGWPSATVGSTKIREETQALTVINAAAREAKDRSLRGGPALHDSIQQQLRRVTELEVALAEAKHPVVIDMVRQEQAAHLARAKAERAWGKVSKWEATEAAARGRQDEAWDTVRALGLQEAHLNRYIDTWGRELREFGGRNNLWGDGDLVELVGSLTRLAEPGRAKGLLRLHDQVLARWKSYALLSPGYHSRNFFSGVWMNGLAGMDNTPDIYFKFGRAWREWSKTSDIDKALAKLGRADPAYRAAFRELVENEGAVLGRTNVRDLLDATGTAGQRGLLGGNQGSLRRKLDPTALDNSLIATNFAGAHKVETLLRGPLFIDSRLKGLTVEESIARVVKYHFDYSDLSFNEMKYMKRIVPFYTWTRKNVPLQLEMIAKRPGYYAAYGKAQENLEMGVPGESIVPQYYGPFAIRSPFTSDQLPTGSKTEQDRVYWMPDLPFTSLDDLFDFGKLRGQMSPIIKTPWELDRGAQFFSGAPFTGKYSKIPSTWKWLGPVLDVMDGHLGLPNAVKRDGDYYLSDRDAYKIEQALPLLGRFRRLAPSESKYQDRMLTSWLSIMGGIGSQTNTEAAQASELLRRSREIEARLKRIGALDKAVDGE